MYVYPDFQNFQNMKNKKHSYAARARDSEPTAYPKLNILRKITLTKQSISPLSGVVVNFVQLSNISHFAETIGIIKMYCI
jgi:hypothetical protein